MSSSSCSLSSESSTNKKPKVLPNDEFIEYVEVNGKKYKRYRRKVKKTMKMTREQIQEI